MILNIFNNSAPQIFCTILNYTVINYVYKYINKISIIRYTYK